MEQRLTASLTHSLCVEGVQFGMKTNATLLARTAEALVQLGLKDLGFVYVNSDDGWNGGREQGPCPHGTRPDGTCPGGKDLPHAPMRPSGGFPDGMRQVADHIHGLGCKLGLYTARHQRTCGNRAGSCMNELIDAQRWANWTVDYIKDVRAAAVPPPVLVTFSLSPELAEAWSLLLRGRTAAAAAACVQQLSHRLSSSPLAFRRS
eukprot:COSAG01_NODE_5000_length_4554_cov_8.000449_1_plen_205_part_00